MKIFIVEDDEKIAGVLSKELENWGYETFMVKDFSKILDEFKIIGPQLVLMDIALPFFNGYLLVSGDKKNFQSSHNIYIFKVGKYRYCYGHESGS